MGRITDDDRRKLEEALAAALLLLYIETSQEQFDALGVDATEPSAEAKKTIAAMAAETALLMQQGVNQRLADGGENVAQGIKDYNESVLLPFLTSWVTHQATLDAYESVPNPGNPGQSMKDAVLWNWERHTDWIYDDCQAAEDASPASYDDLIAIGGQIPSHRRCLCTLLPVAQ